MTPSENHIFWQAIGTALGGWVGLLGALLVFEWYQNWEEEMKKQKGYRHYPPKGMERL